MESFLFEMEDDALDATLRRKAEEGILFYSVMQSRKLLGITECQVRYAIDTYRLDALFLAGEYRIPYTAILEFAGSGWLETSIEYLNAHKAVDIEGVYDLNFNGNTGHIVRSLNSLHMPLEAIPLLLEKYRRYCYDDLPGEEPERQDWYALDELDLPMEETVSAYAGILGTKADWLAWKLRDYCGRKCRISDRVSYPELFDLLVDCELVNYPIPVVLDFSRPPAEPDDSSQLTLF